MSLDPDKFAAFQNAIPRMWEAIMGEPVQNMVVIIEHGVQPVRRTFVATIRNPDKAGEEKTISRMCSGTTLSLTEPGTDYQLLSEQGHVHVHAHGPDCGHQDDEVEIPEGVTRH